MKDRPNFNGEWRCRWLQRNRVGIEKIMFSTEDNVVTGKGVDSDGTFVYDEVVIEGASVSMVKRYITSNISVPMFMRYEGTWDGSQISGWWHQAYHYDYGDNFEMWPIEEEFEASEITEEIVEEVHAGSKGATR
ncbi:MAG: hypothetical protein K8R88_01685 [Armatimonadetes bacterium]|nr:hypothetical protein [Armatimonadota bacterium]